MLLAVVLGLMMAAPAEPAGTTIYVGLQTSEEGFVEADRGILDSVKDVREALRNELQKCSSGKRPLFPWSDCEVLPVRIVADESAADLRLYVLARGIGAVKDAGTLYLPGSSVEFPGTTTTTRIGRTSFETTTPGTTIHTPGVAIPIESKLKYVIAVLRAGTYERAFVAEGQDAAWRKCASGIARDVHAWLAANRERLAKKER